jgi:hypothetical protein
MTRFGTICPGGDTDWFSFVVAPHTNLRVTVVSLGPDDVNTCLFGDPTTLRGVR